MKIAVDVNGGDNAPGVIIDGIIEALDSYPHIDKLVLVGDELVINSELQSRTFNQYDRIEIVHAPETIEMHEPSAIALRSKKKSSITVGVESLKKGDAEAIFSAGHTGASVAASVVKLRTLPGIERPAIATVFPTPTGHFVLIDSGGNVDSSPQNLFEFAIMGEVYCKYILKKENPRIGLLNIGEEDTKGNELTKETFKLLSGKSMNFIGNVEGRDLFNGKVDVVVCDGFVGNIVLKTCESFAKGLQSMLKTELTKTPIRAFGALLSKGAFNELKAKGDYAEYGGAPLLGINGICIIGHGSSNAKAVKNGIRVASEFIEHKVNKHIEERVGELKG